ncbi:MAG: hypothetical protein AABX05_00675 [Nanoarchaeota archaeon]
MAKSIILDDLLLDGEAAKDSKGRYQIKNSEEWNKYYANFGKRLPDFPEYFRFIRRMDYTTSVSLRRDLQENYLCTGTRLNYDTHAITHFGAGKTIVMPHSFPEGEGYMDELIKYPSWRTIIREMFQYADVDEALEILNKSIGKRPYLLTNFSIKVGNFSGGAVWIDINSDRFKLSCTPIIILGRARGISVDNTFKEAPSDMPQSKTSVAPDREQQKLTDEDPIALDYARRLLRGISTGTVMDWKKLHSR